MNTITNIPIGLTQAEWKQVGAYANSLIQNDMAEGKFQNNQSHLQYKSQQYKKYKANGMRRLTKTTKKGRTKAKINLKTGASSGGRLKAYYGQPIESTNTNFVDMTLTGRLKKSLHVINTFENGVTSGYSPNDKAEGKILGNRKLGREVLGLSDENKRKALSFMEGLLRKRIEGFSQSINIDVKF